MTEYKFENIIQSFDSKLFLSNFAKNGIAPNQDCVDSATAFLSDFLVNSAQLASNSENKIGELNQTGNLRGKIQGKFTSQNGTMRLAIRC
jgi:hypothetical protein